MKQIPLTQGQFALVDDSDFEMLNRYKWCSRKLRNKWYVQCNNYKTKKTNIIVMHRFILGCAKGDRKQVDHINGNGCDNRWCNLRACSAQTNQQNSRINKPTKTQSPSTAYWPDVIAVARRDAVAVKAVIHANAPWDGCLYRVGP